MKHLKKFEQHGIGDIDYADLFVDKLKEIYPNGLFCYHITSNKYVDKILKEGLLISEGYRDNQIIHTTLGEFNIGRVSGNSKGFTVFEISINVDEYYKLMPEEATYYIDEIDDLCDDGDCEENLIIKQYMDVHPNLSGGDITFYEDISPDKLRIVQIDGADVD